MSSAALAPAPSARPVVARTLFGVILTRADGSRWFWIGLRRAEAGAVCGAVQAMLVYGLHAVFDDVTDVFPLVGPLAPEWFTARDAAAWVLESERRGLFPLIDSDADGRPIFDESHDAD